MPGLPRILMVADRPDWAYDHIAHFVMTHLASRYQFDIDYLLFNRREPLHSLRGRVSEIIMQVKYRARRKLNSAHLGYDLICYLGWYFPYEGNFSVKTRGIIQGIYTAGFPPAGYLDKDSRKDIEVEEFVSKYMGKSESIVVGSKQIFDFYRPYIKNLYYATLAYDPDLFSPSEKEETDRKEFVVGWTGNPDRAFKGFYEYVVPAVQKAAEMRPGISFQTRFKGPLNTLPDYYRGIDVLIIASAADAGPSSFLEAGLCGVPSISTKVGFPLEHIQDGMNGFFVDRSIEDITNKIIYLYDNKALLQTMSHQIRADLNKFFSAQNRIVDWDNLFTESLCRLNGKKS